MTTSNQAISPKVLPAEVSYALANIDRLERALSATINIIAQANPLLQQHLQQLQQEMQQTRHSVEAQYMAARMSGFGIHSLVQNNGVAIPVAVRQPNPPDLDELVKFLTSRLFDIDKHQRFVPHSGLSVLGTVAEMEALIRDENLPHIKAGLYINEQNQEFILPIRYKRDGLEVLTLVGWHTEQPLKLAIIHNVLVPSEGGWLPDVGLQYFNVDQFKLAFMTELATEIQGQTLCAKTFKDEIDQVISLADSILDRFPERRSEIESEFNDMNDGGMRLIVGRLTVENTETPVGDDGEIRQDISNITRTKRVELADPDGRLALMPWTWRVSQLSTLRVELYNLKDKLEVAAIDDAESSEEE